MAEIDIEKKKSSKPIWPWILGLLLLAGIIWAIAEIDTEPEVAEVAVVEETYAEEPIVRDPQTNIMDEERGDFVSYVEEKEVKENMGVDHTVTSEALRRLTDAIRDLAQNEDAYSQQINELEQTAQQIQNDPQSMQHANMVEDAFTKAANLLQQIQQNRFPEMQSEVEDVQQAANKLEEGQPLLNQKDDVKDFFEKAADAVEKMKEETTVGM